MNDRQTDPTERDLALEEAEIEESQMSTEEIRIRDSINKELSKKKLHLRLTLFSILEDRSYVFDFVPPIGRWANELKRAQKVAVSKADKFLKTAK